MGRPLMGGVTPGGPAEAGTGWLRGSQRSVLRLTAEGRLLSLSSEVTTCPLRPAPLEAALFTTPRPLADVWRHLWLPTGVKGSSVQRTEARAAARHRDGQDGPLSKD